MNYFIADLHLGHTNVLRFDNRPFGDIWEHDHVIIDNWNNTVSANDEVYILGDISWHSAEQTIEFYKNMNGIKHLIAGNHDKKLLRNGNVRALFVEITDYKEITLDNTSGIVLCHYPIPCFNHHFYNWYHFYGHVHNSYEWDFMEEVRKEMIFKYEKNCNMINVGCMMPYMNYVPRSFEEIRDGYEKYSREGMLSSALMR